MNDSTSRIFNKPEFYLYYADEDYRQIIKHVDAFLNPKDPFQSTFSSRIAWVGTAYCTSQLFLENAHYMISPNAFSVNDDADNYFLNNGKLISELGLFNNEKTCYRRYISTNIRMYELENIKYVLIQDVTLTRMIKITISTYFGIFKLINSLIQKFAARELEIQYEWEMINEERRRN